MNFSYHESGKKIQHVYFDGVHVFFKRVLQTLLALMFPCFRYKFYHKANRKVELTFLRYRNYFSRISLKIYNIYKIYKIYFVMYNGLFFKKSDKFQCRLHINWADNHTHYIRPIINNEVFQYHI